MVALQNLAPSENLALPCPSEKSNPPDSKVLPQILKSSPQSHIYLSASPPFCQGGVFYVFCLRLWLCELFSGVITAPNQKSH